jgi:hypothetical protein
MSKDPKVIETHPELKDLNFGGNKEEIKAYFEQSNIKVVILNDASGQEMVSIRERTFLAFLLFFPLLMLAQAPTQIKNIFINIRNKSQL